jgi:hypothetical protein
MGVLRGQRPVVIPHALKTARHRRTTRQETSLLDPPPPDPIVPHGQGQPREAVTRPPSGPAASPDRSAARASPRCVRGWVKAGMSRRHAQASWIAAVPLVLSEAAAWAGGARRRAGPPAQRASSLTTRDRGDRRVRRRRHRHGQLPGAAYVCAVVDSNS